MIGVDRSRLPALAADRPFHFPPIVKQPLPNGLELRTQSHRAAPLVAVSLVLRGGSASDPLGLQGVAALTANLLDEGFDGHDALAVADRVSRIGGELDIEVGYDAVTVSLTMLRRFAAQGLELLARIVTSPALTEGDFERVRKLRLERLRQLRDHPGAVSEQAFARSLYGSHPYAHLGLGTEQALAACTADDVRAFYRGLFAPSGATLVIAGDFGEDALLAMASEAFGPWAGAPDAMSVDRRAGMTIPPSGPSGRLTVVARPGAAQSELRIGHVCCSRDTPDYFSLIVLNSILGGQFVSRLNLNLREGKGYTYGVRTGFDLRRGRGPFVLQTSVQTEVTAAAVRESLGEIDAIRGTRPPTLDELTMAKGSLTRGYARGFETVQGVTRAIAQLALHELPDTYFADFTPSVQAVSLDDVAAAAVRYLDLSNAAVIIVGDFERIRADVAALALGEPHMAA